MEEYVGVITKAEIEAIYDKLNLVLGFKFGSAFLRHIFLLKKKKISELMNDAKVEYVSELVGKPLRVWTTKCGVHSIEILKEAIL